MMPNNSPKRLERTKCSLHILLGSLLLFSKPTMFLILRFADCLPKYASRRIETISEIVTFGIRVSIDLIVDHGGIFLHKSREY
jgi:hypothetical protein